MRQKNKAETDLVFSEETMVTVGMVMDNILLQIADMNGPTFDCSIQLNFIHCFIHFFISRSPEGSNSIWKLLLVF